MKIGHILQQAFLLIFILICIVCVPMQSFATPEYATQTGFDCTRCHVDPSGGSLLTAAGNQFAEELKSQGHYRSLSSVQRVIRLIVGYIHMLAAIAWFGTIMYVHILLKPAYASKGLPKGELRLGWLSMVALLITGMLLTIARVPTFETLYTTRFGILLSTKIILFTLMLSSAVLVTLFIGPKLRKQKSLAPATPASGTFSLEELSWFDGKNDRPAYIAHQGTIYDVTGSRLWKNGAHGVKHAAGHDLTETITSAPHGDEVLRAMPVVGTLTASGAAVKRPFHMQLFYFFAYMNLILVFVITFVIALWRWW
jgi:predicted heme/steroid binding protein